MVKNMIMQLKNKNNDIFNYILEIQINPSIIVLTND